MLSGSYLINHHATPGTPGRGDMCCGRSCTGIQRTGDTVMAGGDAERPGPWREPQGPFLPGVWSVAWSSPGPALSPRCPRAPEPVFLVLLRLLFKAHHPQPVPLWGALPEATSATLRALSARPGHHSLSLGYPTAPSLCLGLVPLPHSVDLPSFHPEAHRPDLSLPPGPGSAWLSCFLKQQQPQLALVLTQCRAFF